jgi:hypothetical protein
LKAANPIIEDLLAFGSVDEDVQSEVLNGLEGRDKICGKFFD